MNTPLVSIIVLTYNSSSTILETLTSLKKQTYSNIELIISDDSSSDNTVDICKEWLKDNAKNFRRYFILTTDKNTGVTANCNRGYKQATGEWIKLIAGDDALYPKAIENLIKFTIDYPSAKIIHSKVKYYIEDFKEDCISDYTINYPTYFINNKKENTKKQFNFLCIRNTIIALSVIIHKSVLEKTNGFDESIKQCEDWPLWLKITYLGIPFYFADTMTGKYRMRSSSISGTEINKNLFRTFFKTEQTIYKKYIKKQATFFIIFINRYDFYLRYILDSIGGNNKNFICKCIYYFLNAPFRVIEKRIGQF